MGLVYVLNKNQADIISIVSRHPELELEVVHQPLDKEGKLSLWPWGLRHEKTETFAWFEGFYLHTWGKNVGKGNEILERLKKIGVCVTDCF